MLQVQRHLTKLFDSMAKLKFEGEDESQSTEGTDASSNDSKVATAMWAKDGEFVNFPSSCDCSGQVVALDYCMSITVAERKTFS